VTLLEISFQRRKAKADASGLLDAAVAESRTLTIAELVRFDALGARIQDFDVQFSLRSNLRNMKVE
jgi:hypothetical protein